MFLGNQLFYEANVGARSRGEFWYALLAKGAGALCWVRQFNFRALRQARNARRTVRYSDGMSYTNEINLWYRID